MERKKILIIGMFDSIHLARWLKQFENDNIDFILFPSKKFKIINSELFKLVKSNKVAKFYLPWQYRFKAIAGYVDFFLSALGNLININSRKIRLKSILSRVSFDLVHALEIQGAGYLYSELPKTIINSNKLILTNWGSDIYYYRNYLTHNKKIAKVVSLAAYYSAECQRDYDLLRNYKFTGKKLPCIPNSGGFTLKELNSYKKPSNQRKLLLCKGYGGLFGRVEIALPAIESALRSHSEFNAFFYSVTNDIEPLIQKLILEFGSRVKYSTVRKPIDRGEILKLFSEALVYIGCSTSDAISTSFLEALVYGAYPIQTNTSCANEWVHRGAICSVVSLDSRKIIIELNKITNSPKLMDKAQINNFKVAHKFLSSEEIYKKAMTFYNLDEK